MKCKNELIPRNTNNINITLKSQVIYSTPMYCDIVKSTTMETAIRTRMKCRSINVDISGFLSTSDFAYCL